ncbi:MAG: ATP-binding protein [Gammaproteobacteria bacterium]
METPVEIRVAGGLAAIADVKDRIAAFGARHGLPPRAVLNVSLAVDELLTNILSYGFVDAHTVPDIRLRLWVEGVLLIVDLSDNGRPFNPLDVAPPALDLSLADKPIGGLGIYFVRQLMDGVEYRREGGYNRLILRQRLQETR